MEILGLCLTVVKLVWKDTSFLRLHTIQRGLFEGQRGRKVKVQSQGTRMLYLLIK